MTDETTARQELIELRQQRPGLVALRAYLRKMKKPAREEFAARCKTTTGHLKQVCRAVRLIQPWLAVNLDRESGGVLNMEELVDDMDPDRAIDWEYIMARKQLRMGNKIPEMYRDQIKLELLSEIAKK
ncbi:hypothetical protein BJP27_24300 (plasmid) [Pseudomonas oryzihabitans]|nr:hypothetical protein BJP27_24300 [Pseudomonas psychrotolerans]